jgi:Electron transfer DM13
MKTKLLLLPIVALLFSCEVEGEFTKDEIRSTTLATSSELNYEGVFSPTSGITVSGGPKIYRSGTQYQLKLEGFNISDGPDLKVYLSTSDTPTQFVNLGNLVPTAVYSIPPQVDLNVYKYVLIHCQQYNHLFAVALLTEI